MSYSIRAIAMTAVAATAMICAAPASAQSIAGSWEASVPMRMSAENGTMVPSGYTPVSITIQQRGDSVFATWAPAPTDEQPQPKKRYLKGVMKDGAAVLTGEPVEGRLVRDGEERVMKIDVTYTLKLVNDAIEGTMSARDSDGAVLNDRAFKATRKKA